VHKEFVKVDKEADLPSWAPRERLARFFHETMAPWNDTLEDVQKALDYCFSERPGEGGYIVLLAVDGELAGGVCMLATGMSGYIPEHILLFISVDPDRRGRGLGGELMEKALEAAPGDVKLHVEYENPAKRLYERMGFTTKYAEMRWKRPTR
jgi:GNAT superfamily N-acetyltransferase